MLWSYARPIALTLGTISLTLAGCGVAEDDYEFDDTFDAPSEITTANSQGRTLHRGDIDVVQVTVPAGASYTITADALDSRTDTTMTVFSAGTLEMLDYNDDYDWTFGSRLFLSAGDEDTMYYVVVQSYSAGALGRYELSLREAEGLDRYEPDDWQEQANPIAPGDEQAHTLHVGADVDWVSVQTVRGERYIGTTHIPDGESTDTVLCLFDPYGNMVVDDDDSGPGLGSQVEWVGDGQVWWMMVLAYDPYYGDGGPYTLTLWSSAQPEPTPTPCADANGNGICDDDEQPCTDANGNGICDDDEQPCTDANGNGICDDDEQPCTDANGDGICDDDEQPCTDANGDGICDDDEQPCTDTDGDGICDDDEQPCTDTDGDGICDDDEQPCTDADGDGRCDDDEQPCTDANGDGRCDDDEQPCTDTDGDGICDEDDPDADGDGQPDDGNGSGDPCGSVSGDDDIGAYRPDAYEPDNRLEDAARMRLNDAQARNLHTGTDIDFARFDAEAGLTYRVSTVVSACSATDTVLSILSEDGAVLQEVDLPDGGEAAFVTVRQSGTVFVRVDAYSRDHFGPYSLVVEAAESH